MNLKVKINNKEYDYNTPQGISFSEDYSETLDSGSIILTHISKINDLKPYDDVYIWDADHNYNETFYTWTKNNEYAELHEVEWFHKHLLVDQFAEELKNLSQGIYEYKIQLFSETKGLENIILPNISITQPLKIEKKIKASTYLQQYIERYSPKIKVVSNPGPQFWAYQNKYILSQSLIDKMSDIWTPDFTLTNPTLREILSKILITKDLIPVVKDNVIDYLDISKRTGSFHNTTTGPDGHKELDKYINFISGSLTSDNYTDNLRKTYSNALSEDRLAKTTEYLGFRDSSSALLKLSDLKLETRFPIYKISKVYMCYYKKVTFTHMIDNTKSFSTYVLIKQDISKLVKLETERNLLSQDWDEFNKDIYSLKDIDELAKYKMCTVGYSIGSNYITGWGTSYTYPKALWDIKATYVENIFRFMNILYPLGSVSPEDLLADLVTAGKINQDELHLYTVNFDEIESKDPYIMKHMYLPTTETDQIKNSATKMKSLTFQVEYEAFYNGAIIHSKDSGRDCVTKVDNSGESLTLLEKDGVNQKEKINRFGNKMLTFNARYTNISQMQELGSVYTSDYEDDVVIFHKEYSIFNNVINCRYTGTKNQVLKNYFTSVYAKHRPYNLMSYSESVTRSDNYKNTILFSVDSQYYEYPTSRDLRYENENNEFIDIISAFSPTTKRKSSKKIRFDKEINYGFFNKKEDYKEDYYVSDVNKFVSGHSLCFNIAMPDNASAGVYIENMSPDLNTSQDYINAISNDKNPVNVGTMKAYFTNRGDYTGSVQKWHILADEDNYGIKEMGFFVKHMDSSAIGYEFKNYNSTLKDAEKEISEIYKNLYNLPKLISTGENSNQLYINKNIYKDNKERLDITMQIEGVANDNNIVLSSNLFKLSELLGMYEKVEENYTVPGYDFYLNTGSSNELRAFLYVGTQAIQTMVSTIPTGNPEGYFITSPLLQLRINKNFISQNEIETGKFDISNIDKRYAYYYDFKDNGPNITYEDQSFFNGYRDILYNANKEFIIKKINYKINEFYCGKVVDPNNESNDYYYVKLIGYLTLTYTMRADNYTDKFLAEYPNYPIVFSTLISNNSDINNGFDYITFYKAVFDRDIIINSAEGWRTTLGQEGTNDNGQILVSNTYINYINKGTDRDLFYKQNMNQGEVIVLSSGENEQPTYPIYKNMFVVLSKDKVNKNLEYESFKPDRMIRTTDKVPDVFNLSNGTISLPKDSINAWISSGFKSVQYWYTEDQRPDVNTNSLKFVFGVNLYKNEKKEEIIDKVYLSMLSNKDTRVFDEKMNLVGNITNFVGRNTLFGQSYVKLNNEKL